MSGRWGQQENRQLVSAASQREPGSANSEVKARGGGRHWVKPPAELRAGSRVERGTAEGGNGVEGDVFKAEEVGKRWGREEGQLKLQAGWGWKGRERWGLQWEENLTLWYLGRREG